MTIFSPMLLIPDMSSEQAALAVGLVSFFMMLAVWTVPVALLSRGSGKRLVLLEPPFLVLYGGLAAGAAIAAASVADREIANQGLMNGSFYGLYAAGLLCLTAILLQFLGAIAFVAVFCFIALIRMLSGAYGDEPGGILDSLECHRKRE